MPPASSAPSVVVVVPKAQVVPSPLHTEVTVLVRLVLLVQAVMHCAQAHELSSRGRERIRDRGRFRAVPVRCFKQDAQYGSSARQGGGSTLCTGTGSVRGNERAQGRPAPHPLGLRVERHDRVRALLPCSPRASASTTATATATSAHYAGPRTASDCNV